MAFLISMVVIFICLCGVGLLLILGLYLLLAGILRWWPFQGDRRHPAEEYFVQDQVVLAGSRADVDAALSQVRGVRLELLEQIEFDQLGPAVQTCSGLPDDLVVGLYRINGLFPRVTRAVEALNNTPAGQGGTVQAEPNYLSGHPWEPEGSPWEPAGRPWEPEGSPLPNTLPPTRKSQKNADPDWFMTQWGFKQIQLDARPEALMGDRVVVGLFDTSPFPLPPGTRHQLIAVDWVNQPTPMNVYASNPFPAATFRASRRQINDVRNHGLFAAGLVHALAPAATLQLVQVLANDNRGDMFTLLRELFKFLQETTAADAGWQGVVINLSLGVRMPPDEAGFNLPPEVRSLIYMMTAANCLNVVVLAASGNGSASGGPQPAELPASMDSVIGVGASNQADRRACFSNRADIAAPGGDGGPGVTSCSPHNQDCSDEGCGFAVIGPAREEPARTGFIFWSGTSFSTPMVSGLAALVQQAGGGAYTPAQVAAILACGATPVPETEHLGAGVINVPRTLTECLRQAGEPGKPKPLPEAPPETPPETSPETPPAPDESEREDPPPGKRTASTE